jgi:hypothetical protein
MTTRAITSILCLIAACGFSPAPAKDPGRTDAMIPEVHSMSKSGLAIGDPLEFAGSGFLPDDDGTVEVTFRGVFLPYGERGVAADFTTPARFVDASTLSIDRFGPYRVPFTRAGNKNGVFRGKIFATNKTLDGRELRQREDSWPDVELTILPSLIVSELEPHGDSWSASCVDVTPDVIALLRYRLRAEAIGFDAVKFRYTIAPSGKIYEHEALGPVDVLGTLEELAFDEVPSGAGIGQASVAIEAIDAAGAMRKLSLDLRVHRPIEVRPDPEVKALETYPPEAAAACIDGGGDDINLHYSESLHDVRDRTVTLALDPMFAENYAAALASHYAAGSIAANTVRFETKDMHTVGWSVQGDTFGGGSLDLSAIARAGFGVDGPTASSEGSPDLDITARLPAKKAGVFYRQAKRLHRTGMVVAFDLCGDASTIGQAVLTDWAWAGELAIGPSCSPAPKSTLSAECFTMSCEM